jgi:hypothetical protein
VLTQRKFTWQFFTRYLSEHFDAVISTDDASDPWRFWARISAETSAALSEDFRGFALTTNKNFGTDTQNKTR